MMMNPNRSTLPPQRSKNCHGSTVIHAEGRRLRSFWFSVLVYFGLNPLVSEGKNKQQWSADYRSTWDCTIKSCLRYRLGRMLLFDNMSSLDFLFSSLSRHRGRGHERCVPAGFLILPSGREGELRHGQQRHPVPRHRPRHRPVAEGTGSAVTVIRVPYTHAIPSHLLQNKVIPQVIFRLVCVCV